MKQSVTISTRRIRERVVAAHVALGLLAASGVARAQSFNSGSTGADGALDLTGASTAAPIDFNPAQRSIDTDGDHVFHFTTITIPAGVTLKLSAKYINGPVYWLASGAVNIAGTVDLSGADGHPRTQAAAERAPSVPGPGGYPGGVGGNTDPTTVGGPQPGAGPGGGVASPVLSGAGYLGGGGSYTGSKFLVPLQGGSGGGGGQSPEYLWWGGGGGAGGGALLISSSSSINVSGSIRANGGGGGSSTKYPGGQCYYGGGGGSAGAIRLVAPTIQGSGTLAATLEGTSCNRCDGSYGLSCGANGQVRLEAFQQNWTFSIQGNYTTGAPNSSYVPSGPPPAVMVTAIGTTSVPPNPNGSFDPPDAVINTGAPVTVQIQANGVPAGTVVKLYLFSLDAPDQVVDSSPLSGSLQSSTATATVTFPTGFTRGYARAKW